VNLRANGHPDGGPWRQFYTDDDAIRRLERSPCWVWTAMDPESRLLVVIGVGTHTLAMAQCVLHQAGSGPVRSNYQHGSNTRPTALRWLNRLMRGVRRPPSCSEGGV
jgi:hypothetical protein